jgi:2-polyprenyl-3-methyl-5-hydroxy-6-metoxy-1,4-benzoquinol methylase
MFEEKLNQLGFREASPKPNQRYLDIHYSEKYYQDPTGSYAANYSQNEIAHFYNIARLAEYFISKHVDLKHKSLLDLGCGEGYFSHAFYKLNWNVKCSDFSSFGVTKHNPEIYSFFEQGDIFTKVNNCVDARQTYSFINLQNVLEHVIDPIMLLERIKLIMAPESVLRIRVPNDYSSFQMALLKQGLTSNTWFTPPDHLSYFNRDGLTKILLHCGFQIISLQANFPIEVFLINPNSNYWKDKNLGNGAHMTRVFCENYLIEKDMDAYITLSEAAAKLEYGRELIVYAKKL